MTPKDKLIAWLNDQIGYTEGANNWNRYAARLDAIPGLTWGAKQNLPWCGEFVLAAFLECFGVDKALELLCSPKPTGIPVCSIAAGYFQSAGCWGKTPQVGAVIFFAVGGEIGHTGVVTAVGMGAITTVEGNSSDRVARREYPIGDPSVAGYGYPRWEMLGDDTDATTTEEDRLDDFRDFAAPDVATTVPDPDRHDEIITGREPEPDTCEVPLPILREGDESEAVRAAQRLLIARGFPCGGSWSGRYLRELPDGEFGPKTKASVLAFQDQQDLQQTGEIDGATWAALITT